MKVLHVLEYSRPNISGYSLRSDAIIRYQRQLGVETLQLTSQRYQDFIKLEEDIDGIIYQRTLKSDSILAKIPLVNYFHHINFLAKRIEKSVLIDKPDVIQTHSPMFNALAAIKVGRKYKIPVTYEVRALWEDAAVDTGKTKEGSLKYKLIKSIEQRAFEQADAVSCICQGLKQDLINRGIPEKKLYVTPNAVDISKFQPLYERDNELEQSLNLTNKKVVAFIGTFFKYEGLHYAIDAMKVICQHRQDIHLLLVGAGNELSNLKHQVDKLGLESNVSFIGRVPFEEVSRYYSLANIMVFPRESIRLTELVTPLKPLESMAQYKPVIASDIGGHKELIEDNKTGFLFKADDANALATTILTTIDNDELLTRISDEGLIFVREQRNWLNTAKQYLPVYERLIK
ncbi:TIGR04063 family PEP-CTERM/XrtA system glycosyltransferase [Thalassotalea castellviae]|uniref:Glycosyltransferase, exosortase A system-associated n=1 Tax=Thalassotalea castellviae TaxID=3075612 RepID=A0ABU3A0W8_9GAMM|nr:TIGR04063 family PEP-CTERM/XrtA system glycosyltransferase [Thalassotalea sp. W431]MDT0603816.1 glycosyltransferase, exosortase A system-associated [Thalassotalea sp. W431]